MRRMFDWFEQPMAFQSPSLQRPQQTIEKPVTHIQNPEMPQTAAMGTGFPRGPQTLADRTFNFGRNRYRSFREQILRYPV